MTKTIQTDLNKIVQIIVQEFQPERIILFGSFTNNQEKLGSDFDLFIIKNTTKREIDRVRELRSILPRQRKYGIDLVILNEQEFQQATKEKNIFVSKILNTGKELYAKNARSHNLVKSGTR